MQVFRLAESTELNNACIVGIACAGTLVAIWLIAALSNVVIRQAAQFLRLRALQGFLDGYGRRARITAVLASFAAAVAGAAVLAYTLSQHKDLQRSVDEIVGEMTQDAILAVVRVIGVVCLFLVAFYLLKVVCHRLIARVRGRLTPRVL